jgi:hypothetical protein
VLLIGDGALLQKNDDVNFLQKLPLKPAASAPERK